MRESIHSDFPSTINPWSLLVLLRSFERQDASPRAYEDLLDFYFDIASGTAPNRSRNMRDVAMLCTVLAIGIPAIRGIASLYAVAMVCAGANLGRYVDYRLRLNQGNIFVNESDGITAAPFCTNMDFRGTAKQGNLEFLLYVGPFQKRLLKRLRRRYMVDRYSDRMVAGEEWISYSAVLKLVRDLNRDAGRQLEQFINAGLKPSDLRMASAE
jgi:hypothetical protein